MTQKKNPRNTDYDDMRDDQTGMSADSSLSASRGNGRNSQADEAGYDLDIDLGDEDAAFNDDDL